MSDYKWKPFTLLVSAEEVERVVGFKLEAGKYYKTRDGRKVGPLTKSHLGFTDGIHNYTEYGMAAGPLLDIISEWSESPIREVTRRELVAGVYGRVYVEPPRSSGKVAIELTEDDGKIGVSGRTSHL